MHERKRCDCNEGHLIDIVRRGGDSTRFAAVKFALINCGAEDWKQKLPDDLSVEFSLAALVDESLKLAQARMIGAPSSSEAGPTPAAVEPIEPRPLQSRSRQDQ